jgi:hypothetical protein
LWNDLSLKYCGMMKRKVFIIKILWNYEEEMFDEENICHQNIDE